jgi:DNA-binding response OmpR family regulator
VNIAPRILIVDASRESREVLRVLLERRGAKTLEAERPEDAIFLARDEHPDLIVFDAESDNSGSSDPTNDLREIADGNNTPIVILGKVRQLRSPISAEQIMAKPYHYGPLIRKINSLLAAA